MVSLCLAGRYGRPGREWAMEAGRRRENGELRRGGACDARAEREGDVFGGQSYPPEPVDEWIRLVSGSWPAAKGSARVRPTRPIPRARSRPPIPTSFLVDKAPSLRAPAATTAGLAAHTTPDGHYRGGVDQRGGQGVRERGRGRGAAAAGRRAGGGLVRGARGERAGAVDGGGAAPLRGPGGGRRRDRRRPRPPPALRRGGLRRGGGSGAQQGPARGSEELRLRLGQGLLQGRAGAAQGHPMDRGRAQIVSAGAGQVRQGRLAEHLAQLRHLPDADAGGQPRAEVLHPPQLHEPGPAPLQHPRHHQHQQRRAGGRPAADAARPHHRPFPRRAGAARRHHEASSRDGGHVRGSAHGPPGGRPHGPRRRRDAGHVPAGAGPPALRHARRLPGAEPVSMHAMLAWPLLWFVRERARHAFLS